MKILLTGASGFLGCVIKDVLKDMDITSLSRSEATIICDLALEVPMLPAFDFVIHAAGKAHFTPTTIREREDFFNVNVKGTANLLKGLESSGVPKSFVFISSIAVYGKENGYLIKENASLLAKDPYGISKIYAEKLVKRWCTKNNVICTILRVPLIAGANAPGNLGALVRGIQKGYYFNIAGGKARKSIVLAEDIAKIILKAGNIGGIFNLTDRYHPSFKELSFFIASQLNKKKPINLHLGLAMAIAFFGDILGKGFPLNSAKVEKMTSTLTFDDTKAQMLLDWKPKSVLAGFRVNGI
jgi:nucleoside-diphosphate-sugar epimerase